MTAKFKPGDKVKVVRKSHINVGWVVPEMSDTIGKVLTILWVSNSEKIMTFQECYRGSCHFNFDFASVETNEESQLSHDRKSEPVYSGVLNYFPDAIAAVSRVSKKGNDKHNPGEPLHWSRDKSNDHYDCAVRHLMTPKEIDPDSGEVHLAHAAWRVLAALQLLLEEKKNE